MQTINLHIHEKTIIPVLYAKQGDVGRKFQVVIADGIPDGVTFSAWYSGASGEGNYTDIGDRSAFAVEGNTITVELITQMLTNAGRGALCLVMSGADGSQLATWNIPYEVEPVPGMGSAAAEQYYSAFFEAAAAAADSAARAETAAIAAEEAAETSATAAEAVRLTATEDTPGTVTLALGGGSEPTEPKVYCDNDFNTDADGITFETKPSANSGKMYSERRVDAAGNGYLYLRNSKTNDAVAFWNKGEDGLAVQQLPEKFVLSFDAAVLNKWPTTQFRVCLVDENGSKIAVMNISNRGYVQALFVRDDGKTDYNQYLLTLSTDENIKYYPITMAFDMESMTFSLLGSDYEGAPWAYARLKFRVPSDGFGTVQYIEFQSRHDDTDDGSDPGSVWLDNLKIYEGTPMEAKPLKGIRFPGLYGTYSVAPGGFGLGEYCAAAIENNDANNAIRNGKYHVYRTTANSPGVVGVMEVSVRNLGYAHQKVIEDGTGIVFRRRQIAGAWDEWEYENPPMEIGVEYRTTERYTHKAVYTMLLDCGAVPGAGAEKQIAHEIFSIDRVLRCNGTLSSGNTLPLDREGYGTISCMATPTEIILRAGADNASLSSWLSAHIQIWYTKN